MINIDLKNLNNEYDVGFIGEHNAEKLHIDISSIMSSDISFFVCVFCNGYAETYNSERYYVKDMSDNSINTVLSQSLTKTEKCKMIVGAYGEDENGKINLLKKSDIVNLHFLDSLDDTNAVYKPEVEGLYKELVDLENKFNDGLDLLESKLESIATATAGANAAATSAIAAANDIKQKSENGYFNGAKGDKGDPGTPGRDGAPGKDGYTPIKGVDYFDGAKGDKGDKGEKGEKGDKGEQGEKGEQGIQGIQGLQGASGKDATINGKNAVNILAGDNINIDESGENIKISASNQKQIATNENEITDITEIVIDDVDNPLVIDNEITKVSNGIASSQAVYKALLKQNDWELIRTITVPENPTTDTSDITFLAVEVDGENKIFGFSFDTDENGNAYELTDFFVDGTGEIININNRGNNDYLHIMNNNKTVFRGYRCFSMSYAWTLMLNNIGGIYTPLVIYNSQYNQTPSILNFNGNGGSYHRQYYNNWTNIGLKSDGNLGYAPGTILKFYGKRK